MPPFDSYGWVLCRQSNCDAHGCLRQAAEIQPDQQCLIIWAMSISTQSARFRKKLVESVKLSRTTNKLKTNLINSL